MASTRGAVRLVTAAAAMAAAAAAASSSSSSTSSSVLAAPSTPAERFAAAGGDSWWFPGNPVANPSAVVTAGSARFTVLTPSLIRMEFVPAGANASFVDAQTMAIWNRNLPVPQFTSTPTSSGVVIDTGALLLNYSGYGTQPFSDTTLSITVRNPSFAFPSGGNVWTPSQQPGNDPGQLFGTFHTLDGVGGPATLNCSLLDPLANGGLVSFYPCDFGLVSQSGWSIVDDSRRPVIVDDWPAPNPGGVCDANISAPRAACFPGGDSWEPSVDDSIGCEQAGCCWDDTPYALNLYYSPSREDHFTDATCTGCQGLDYAFERVQGFVFGDNASNPTQLIPLNLYWNAQPGAGDAEGRRVGGAHGDNVASTFPPAQPGYMFVHIQGWIYSPSFPQPAGTNVVKLWYSAEKLDHFTTVVPADEAEAVAGNYSLVATLGYMMWPNASYPPDKNVKCFQRTRNSDLYFFGHGMNYLDALGDFASIAGPIPIPRRHWLGMSWSKWDEDTTQDTVYSQLSLLQEKGFPLSTFIFDMQWHLQPGWTGYTWDPVHYPNVTEMLAYIHSFGIPIGANLHDADGVGSFEAVYPQMAAANGIDPSTNQTIDFHISSRTYAQSLHDIVLGAVAQSATQEGFDLWWTDFQQGLPGIQDISGITPTILLNHYRFRNHSQPGSLVRGTTHSRYGGLGDHRYPSQFGGDVSETWNSLQFMVEFTVTAANVLVGYWGHEIMRNGGNPTDQPELFTRLVQFGSFSPTYTNWGNSAENDDLWNITQPYFNATLGALLDRAQFIPYRYTAAKIAYDTAVSPLRPMYYHHPASPDAYSAPQQYYLGPDVLVAPVYVQADPNTGLAPTSVWFPPSTSFVYYNDPTQVFSGGRNGVWESLFFPLSEVPLYVRAGAVLPLTPLADASGFGAAAKDYASLQFVWFPGWAPVGSLPTSASSGGTWVYEDDGVSNDYLTGVFANTTATYTVSPSPAPGGNACATFTIATAGSYPRLPATRSYSVWMVGVPSPATVTADGQSVPKGSGDGVAGTWWVDTGARSGGSALRVYMAPASTAQAHTVQACWAS